MKKSRILLLTAMFLSAFVLSVTQQVRAEDMAMMNSEMSDGDAAMKEVAMEGNCAICMLSGMKMAGKDEFTTEYEGKIYKFDSEEHKNMFLADAAKYAEKMDNMMDGMKEGMMEMKEDMGEMKEGMDGTK